jgi:hypothetical protein
MNRLAVDHYELVVNDDCDLHLLGSNGFAFGLYFSDLSRSNLWIKSSVSKVERGFRAFVRRLRDFQKEKVSKALIAPPLVHWFAGLRVASLNMAPLIASAIGHEGAAGFCKSGVMTLAILAWEVIHD